MTTRHHVAPDLGLHCLLMTFYGFLDKNGLTDSHTSSWTYARAPYRGYGYVPLRFGGTSLEEWKHNNTYLSFSSPC